MAESPSELQAEIEKLERKHAENPEGRYFVPLANACRKQGDLERAESLLREGLRRHPDYLSAHIVLGRCLADREAVREAADEFRYVLSLDPQNLIALRTLGELATSEGRHDEANRWYQELLSVDPMNEDARRALESLSVAPSEPADEFQQDAAWWERPAEAEEDTPAPHEHGLREPAPFEPEPLPQEAPGDRFAAADDEPLRIETAADSFAGAGLDFGGAREPSHEAEPEQAPEDAPFAGFGRLDDIAFTPAAAGDEPDPSPEEETDLVTETIAELYARQGFYGRSAEVYRELVRRRGGDAGLEQRLAEVERLAREHAEPGAPALDHEEQAPTAEDLVLTGYGEVDLEPASTPEPAPVGEPAPQDTGGEDDDWLAAVSDFGLEEEPVADEGGTHDQEPNAAPDPFAASFQHGFGDAAPEEEAEEDALPPAPPAARPEPQADRQPTIAAFLSGLAGWRSGAAAEAAPEPARDEPEPEPLPAWDEPAPLPLPEMDAPRPAVEAEAESGTMSADAEPFPWELPSLGGPATGAPAPEREQDETGGAGAGEDEASLSLDEPSFSLDEAERAAPAAPAPDVPAAPAAPAQSAPAAPEGGDEDEDLESFQAWLRSLKR